MNIPVDPHQAHATVRYIGESVPRPNAQRLLQGRGSFTDDLRFPRLAHVAFFRSPYAHALIRSIDVKAALDMPGVKAVFTAADLAMYALVLSHTGPQLMAVTSNLDLNFLNKGALGDVLCVYTRISRVGTTSVTVAVARYSGSAQVQGSSAQERHPIRVGCPSLDRPPSPSATAPVAESAAQTRGARVFLADCLENERQERRVDPLRGGGEDAEQARLRLGDQQRG